MRRRNLTSDALETGSINSLRRGLEVLRCFGPGDQSLTAADVAWRLGIPKATALQLLATLTSAGFLRAGKRPEAFGLYAECLLLGHAFLSSSALARKARPVLQAFADRFNVHAMLSTLR